MHTDTTTTLVDQLVAFPRFAALPRPQLEWLASRGRVLRYDDGAVMYWKEGDPRGTFIILKGRLSSRTDRGGVTRVVRELGPGTITGVLPYSRVKTPSAYTVAVGALEMLVIDEDDLLDMIRECHDFTTLCVHEMVDRTRIFKSEDLNKEKMAALGRLSAGLAHELGNPSSAIVRSAARLAEAQLELAAAARALGSFSGEEAVTAALGKLEAAADRSASASLPALELSEREEQLIDWLTARGVDDRSAHPLAAGGLTVSDIEAAASALAPEALAAALGFLAARMEAGQLATEVSTAAGRVHSLVEAVKKHTHMDRAPVVESIALEEHLANAMTLLEAKARAREVALDLSVEPDLPPVDAMVGDLNQVWINLVDNAIDAAGESGRVLVTARREGDSVRVDVEDSGPGIAAENRARVFDPFFTTKGVGEGAGLGLHIVRSVVESHRGSVTTESEPGRTRFSVRLPVGKAVAAAS